MAVKASDTITLVKVDDGETGTGVSNITKEFYVSTSKTLQVGGSWGTTMPEWSVGNYLWKRDKIVYKDPVRTEYTEPECDSSWEAVNDVEQDIKNAQDAADKAGDDANDAINQAIEAKASLELLEKSIETLVTDENGASMMVQTPTGWKYNMGAFESTLGNAIKDIDTINGDVGKVSEIANKTNQLANDLALKTAYINMSTDENNSPCIELGKSDNEFKLRITNTSIDFMQGSQKIAYITNKSLYIQSSVVTDEMQIGDGVGFIWKRRSSGNMGLRRKG